MTTPTKERATRIRRVADGLRRIQEFEAAAMLDSYAKMLEPVSDEEVRESIRVEQGVSSEPINGWGDKQLFRMRAALESFLAGRAR